MKACKRILFWGLLAGALWGSWQWVLHVPYDARILYRALPARASFASHHLRLAARWGDLVANPIFRSLLQSAGFDLEALAALDGDAESKAWFERLAGREVVFAYVPPANDWQLPGWVGASWLGRDSRILRWQLSWGKLPGFQKVEVYRGHLYWRVFTPTLEPAQKLHICFVNGMLLASISSDRLAMRAALDVCDGVAPGLWNTPAFQNAFGAEALQAPAPDSGWTLWRGGRYVLPSPVTLTFAFEKIAPLALQGSLRLHPAIASLATPDPAPAMDELSGLLRDYPSVVARLPPALAFPLALEWGASRDARMATRLLAKVADDPLFAGLLDGDLSGRLWGLRIPALVLATPATNTQQKLAAMTELLDEVNAAYRSSFLARPVVSGQTVLYVLQSAQGDEWVDQLPLEERPAYGIAKGWLLAASNLGTLKKMVEAAGLPAVGAPPWQPVMRENPAGMALWLDLERSGKAARMAISTYALKQLWSSPAESQGQRQQLNEWKAWVDALAPMQTAEISLATRQGKTELRLKAGP